MTPEEAQRKTEEKWKAIAGGDTDISPGFGCGWCKFAANNNTGPDASCHFCPVDSIHGKQCLELPVIDAFCAAYSSDEWIEEAQAVYEFLCQMGPQYIAKAHEILEEKEHEA